MRIIRAAGLLLALATLAPGCAREPGSADPGAPAAAALPPESPDIIGSITRRDDTGRRLTVLVEQVPERSAGYPIASVTVPAQARVLRRQGGRVVTAPASALVAGTPVRMWFTGAVRESYPVQADARVVLIER